MYSWVNPMDLTTISRLGHGFNSFYRLLLPTDGMRKIASMRVRSGSLCQMLRQSIRRSVTLLGVVLPQRKKNERPQKERCPSRKRHQKTIISWTFACRFKFMKFIYWRVSKWVVNPLLDNFFGSLNKQALLVGC